MNDSIPLVSVIVPCYNHARDVRRCLDSIFKQTFQNFELIVIDDCSQDNSVEVIERLLLEHSFRFIKNQKNLGLIANLNKIIFNEARGQYIKLIASDDFLSLDCLEVLTTVFEKQNENCAFVYGKAQSFLFNHQQEFQFLPFIMGKKTNFQELLFGTNLIPSPAVMFSRQKYIDIGGVQNFYIEDLYLWLKFLEKYDCYFVDSVVSFYKTTSNSESMSKQAPKCF